MVVVEAMSLFSFPDSDALKWLQSSIERALSRCYQCAEKYQTQAKKELCHITKDVYGYNGDNVDNYFAKIQDWDQERLAKILQSTIERAKDKEVALSDQRGPGFEAATLCALFECLWCPSLCEVGSLQQLYYTVFIGIQEGGKLLRVAGSILPAMYTFAFSADRKLRDWSRKCFDKAKGQVPAGQFDVSGKEEVLKACRRLRDGQADSSSFWYGLQCVLRYTDPSAVFNATRDAEISLMDFICGEINTPSPHLMAVMQTLNSLLPVLSTSVWAACPLPAQEVGTKIINNPKFIELLAHPESLLSFSANSEPLTECVYWMRPYALSQYGGNKYRVALQLLHFLFDDKFQHILPAVSQVTCGIQGMKIIQSLLRDLANSQDKDAKRSFQIELRSLIDFFAQYIGDVGFSQKYSKPEWATANQIALDIIILTVQLDCDVLWFDYVSLSTTEFWSAKENKYSAPQASLIWSILSKNTSAGSMGTLQRFVEVVGKQISLIDTIEITSKMSNELRASIEIFNRTLNGAIGISNAVIQDIGGLWSPAQIKSFLQRSQTNEGTIALMFSPNHETYQEILNLMKEAHEAEGRIEAFRSSFKVNFESTVQAMIHVMNSWSMEGIFKSAARIIRTASNVLDILFSTRDGLISTDVLGDVPLTLLPKLWRALWRMLETAYRMALTWADKFDKEDLIEFMRDVLECSDLLLQKFGAFVHAIGGQSASQQSTVVSSGQRELDGSLLDECLQAVKSLTTWLRLNNEDLLQSCVNLVCKILGHLAKAGIKINDETVFIFDRLIINSKKHKNCLTEAQRTEIYISLCEHTESPEEPDDVQVITRDQMTKPEVSRTAVSIHDQVQLAAARKTASTPVEKYRLPNVSLKSSAVPVIPPAAVPERRMTATERAEFLKKRAGALPLALQSKKPLAKNASAGATKRDESSASDSDSEDDIEGLFTSNDPKSPLKRRVEKRQTQKLDIGGPHIIRRDPKFEKNRIEQNLRARTNPDLTELHTRLLSWSPGHDGAYPPDSNKSEYSRLINSYQTADKYRKAVEPLFLLETWQHIVSSRENIKEKDKFEFILQTRSAVDNFVDLVATMSMVDWKKYLLSDPDLLMLSTTTDFAPGHGTTSEKCLAKVQNIFKKKDIVEVGLRTVPDAGMVKHLRPTVRLYCVKLSGLTPIHREYATIKALPYYDLCDEIVMGRPSKGSALHPTDIDKVMKAYGVNEPQAKAIDAALNNTGFTLIQGPPGTGKTKTILGMVGAFLSASKVHGVAISIPGQRQAVKKDDVKKRKILLCAPSNAAVDEIVLRLKNGILTSKGEKYVPKIVRMGMSDAININVQDVTLDALLDDMLNRVEDKLKGSNSNDPTELRTKLNVTLKERDVQRALLEKARSENRDTQGIESAIKKLNNLKTHLGEQLDDLRDKQSQKARAKDIERKRFQTQILADADVICATLSGSGHDLMASIAVDFETVIIDEACQTTELSALIPLKYGCTRCIMVGDPNQLPPTVLSTEAVGFAYNESLFVRMQRNNPNAVRLLAIQYRMHSSISRFPSKQFYDGHLLDGPDVDNQTRRSWHASTIFGTYRFFDVRGREEESNKHSVYNVAEAKAALAIVQRLQEDFFDVDFDGRIGIVTPYKEQHHQIRKLFQREFGQNILSTIDFNTVDGFQGQEKDIIIFSCVRANENRGIGFLSDVRRMNVALTRAKSSIFILGHAPALRSNPTWRALVEDAESRKLYTSVQHNTFTSKARLEKQSPKQPIQSQDRKREPSPTPLGKDSVKRPKIDPLLDGARKSSIFETFKRPDHPTITVKKETTETTAKTLTSSTAKEPRRIALVVKAEQEEKSSPHVESDDPLPQSPQKTPHNTHPPPSQQPPKKKSETSLFIKRKKPVK